MANTKHARGLPTRPIRIKIVDANDFTTVHLVDCIFSEEERAAIFQAMTAAPELLRACYDAVRLLDDYANRGDNVQAEIEVLEAAIARAEGRE